MTSPGRLRTAALRLITALIVVTGVNAAAALGLRSRLMFELSLDWWNFDDSAAGFFVHCLALAGAVVAITHYGVQWRQRRRRARASSAVPE